MAHQRVEDLDMPTISSSVGDLRSSIMRLRISLGPGQALPLVHVERVRSMRAMLQALVDASLGGTWVHSAMANDFIRGLHALEELEKLEAPENEGAAYQDVEEDSGYPGYNDGYEEGGGGGFLGCRSFGKIARGGGSNAVTDALLMAQHSLALLVVHYNSTLQQELASCQERLAQAEAALSQVQADKSELLVQYAAQGTQLSELMAMEALLSGALTNSQAMVASLSGGTPCSTGDGGTPIKIGSGYSSFPDSPPALGSQPPARAALGPVGSSECSSSAAVAAASSPKRDTLAVASNGASSRGSSRFASPCLPLAPAASSAPSAPRSQQLQQQEEVSLAGSQQQQQQQQQQQLTGSRLAPRRHGLTAKGMPPIPLSFEEAAQGDQGSVGTTSQQEASYASQPLSLTPPQPSADQSQTHRPFVWQEEEGASATGSTHEPCTPRGAANVAALEGRESPSLPLPPPSLCPPSSSLATPALPAPGTPSSAVSGKDRLTSLPAAAAAKEGPASSSLVSAAAGATGTSNKLRPLALFALPAERAAASILARTVHFGTAGSESGPGLAAGGVSGRDLQLLRLLQGVLELDHCLGQVLQGSYGIMCAACSMAWSTTQLCVGSMWPSALLRRFF